MINLYGLELKKLQKLLENYEQKPYRAVQLYTWIYEKKVTSFDEMSDVSIKFREILKRDFSLSLPKIHTKQVSNDGTIKLLLELEDGYKVETVLMRYNYGNAVCVSIQVGCNMGCSFCSSGILGKQRNLLPHEMVGEVLVINNLLKKKEEENMLLISLLWEQVNHLIIMKMLWILLELLTLKKD